VFWSDVSEDSFFLLLRGTSKEFHLDNREQSKIVEQIKSLLLYYQHKEDTNVINYILLSKR